MIRTSPATSEKARITSDIGVVTNPDREPERIPYQPATGDGQNPCEPSPQGYEPPSLEGPFRLVDTLRGPGRAPVVHLYEGIYENQWGYRHILIDHGWGAVDRDETELALHFGYEEQGSDRPGAIDSWTYYLSTPSRNGVPCARIVVLELGTHSGEPDPRHIITSFAAPKA